MNGTTAVKVSTIFNSYKTKITVTWRIIHLIFRRHDKYLRHRLISLMGETLRGFL